MVRRGILTDGVPSPCDPGNLLCGTHALPIDLSGPREIGRAGPLRVARLPQPRPSSAGARRKVDAEESESLVHPALAAVDDRAEVLILGGGEGATLREVLRHPGVRRCTMVDIDGEVVELSKKYLAEWSAGAFDDPRANVIIGDALAYLKTDPGTYGVIISDLTEPLADSPSFPLFNGDVFADIKARLAPGGVYVLQASTAGFHNMALHAKMARSLRRFFTNVASFYTHVPAFDNDWAFIACSDAIDVASLEPARIDRYVDELRGENYFYDAQTHRRLFSLPLYLRRELAQDGSIFA